mmetsp:Transcript_33709/g.32733  ORF Transcript_33709/g.32733 Transcript_33709/m.32733 type:complete len:185 (+) Transcript_33709:221-775(+)
MNKSNETILKEFEIKNEQEAAKINSTGFRLRAMTSKYGASVDLVSHGFKKYNMKEIDRYFDPMRLKLIQIPLSDVPNQDSKIGADYHFIQGLKSMLKRDYGLALNSFDRGIQEQPRNSFNCKFNKGVVLFKLGLFQEALLIYRELSKIDRLDKRVAFNRAVCEIQNGRYKHCIKKIDKFLKEYG